MTGMTDTPSDDVLSSDTPTDNSTEVRSKDPSTLTDIALTHSDSSELNDRSRSDKCPGALSLHVAEDGMIGRVRFPGGVIAPEQWASLADISTSLGDGSIHITTRGNVQIRGIKDAQAFARAVETAGFLPQKTHDKIRNIVASPLATHLWPVVEMLDKALLADDVVAGLSGRTLFGFDDGSGDVLAKEPDFGALLTPTGEYAVLVGGKPTGHLIATAEELVAVLVALAHEWQLQRGELWQVKESESFSAGVDQIVRTVVPQVRMGEVSLPEGEPVIPIGWLEHPVDDALADTDTDTLVSLGAGMKFGVLSAEVAKLFSLIGVPVSVTPWASVVIHDLAPGDAEVVAKVLAPRGLIFDAASPWLSVSACTGRPGCNQALSDTRGDAAQFVAQASAELADGTEPVPQGVVHFSGCERQCGHPTGPHTEYVAVADGEYDVREV